jgi:hypothetical protein
MIVPVMKKTAIIIFLGVILGLTSSASAQEVVLEIVPEVNLETELVIETPVTQAQILERELLELRTREQETSSFFTKLVLRTRIRQIENQLNIKKALQ